jgi:hypothetical protein
MATSKVKTALAASAAIFALALAPALAQSTKPSPKAAQESAAPKTIIGGPYPSILVESNRTSAPPLLERRPEQATLSARSAAGDVVVSRTPIAAPDFRAISVEDWRQDFDRAAPGAYATSVAFAPAGKTLSGLQVGLAYSPSLRQCADGLCAPGGGITLAPDGRLVTETPRFDDVVEASLFYQKRLSSDGFLLGVGARYVDAAESAQRVSPLIGGYQAYSLGVNLGYRGVTIGGSVKSSNAGLAAASLGDNDDYLAFDAGITFRSGEERGDWGFMLGYGQSEANVIGPNPVNPTLFRDTQRAQAGVTYFIGRGVTIGAAAQYSEANKAGAAVGEPADATTVVIESSIKF